MMESASILFSFWSLMTISALVLEWPMIFIKCIPANIQNFVKYGKLKTKEGKSILGRFDIHKKYFTHFYAIACIWNIFLAAGLFQRYFLNSQVTTWLASFFEFITGGQKGTPVDALSTVFGMLLLLIQVCRRLYECVCVSVYSESTMSILIYIVGVAFYLGSGQYTAWCSSN